MAISSSGAAMLAVLAVSSAAFPQDTIPLLPYAADPDWPALPANTNFQETSGISVDPAGFLWIFHRGSHPLMKFDFAGRLLSSFGDGLYGRPHAVRVDRDGALWTVDAGAHTVLKMDANGRIRMVLGRKNQAADTPDHFNQPTDVAFASDGSVFVSDGYGNSRVVKYAKDGTYVTAWGKKGSGQGEFNLPHSIVIDGSDRVYVGDRENRRIQIFDAGGRFLQQWTDAGSPWGLCLDPDGRHIWMVDGYNNRILKLTLEGKIVGRVGAPGKLPGQLNFGHQISVDAQGNVYVAEILNWRAQKFIPTKSR
jgi:DNA-binding beta-propeller fold protein YncE